MSGQNSVIGISPSTSRSELFWTVWAALAAFGAYFCMYAFRKPFTAATYEGSVYWGHDFKTILVISQVFGYMLSKFLGIRVVSEIHPHRRALWVLWLVLMAEGALVLFGLIPRPWNLICLFLNGLPLGMVFGMVMGLLEGRRMTEALTSGLCASFILADGVTKSVGAAILVAGVSEEWMPALAGAMFLTPLAISVAMLSRVPRPSSGDISARSERVTMDRNERSSFLRRYFPGVAMIVLIYLAVTVLRSLRADFATEIWKGLGVAAQPETFSRSEIWVAVGVLMANGLMVTICDNRVAFFSSLGICALGICLLLAALLLRTTPGVSPFAFMVLLGLGLYLPYVAIHTTVFERWLAMTRDRGTTGFLMYVVDSIGYLGYVTVMIGRQCLPRTDDMLGLLLNASWITVGISAVCLLGSWRYFQAIANREASRLPCSAVVETP
jgi:hypothetical protein